MKPAPADEPGPFPLLVWSMWSAVYFGITSLL